ncbi:MAG: type II toxin-antitoxin system RelE/ParE family toxin [Bacteroidetes bacterium]|nr:type II toxin-antitoxin system RelE/ParE family toxin [Bacteroidota bacterium]
MAKRIVWTEQAQRERRELLSYWIDRNKSKTYSVKLNNLFKEWVLLLSKRPEIGKPTDIDGIRVKVVRDYLLFYEVRKEIFYVLSIWDGRRDPKTRKLT